MSKFDLKLSCKNIFILKHSLEKRIEADENRIKGYIFEDRDPREIEALQIESNEHKRCLESLIKEIKRTGDRHGRNVFGSKYND